MGNDSDFHSELSGLAHNSGRDQNWQAGNNAALKVLVEQLTRKEDIQAGDFFIKSLHDYNKPRSDDSKHSNLIHSPVYTIKTYQLSDRSQPQNEFNEAKQN